MSGVDATRMDHVRFMRMVQPFHRELLAHCRRMLGSAHDAEDQVQETYLRAWRSIGTFEGRSSLRTWLYRIATNVCRTALEDRRRLPVPSGIARAEPADDEPAMTEVTTTTTGFTDPAEIIAAREDNRFALGHAWRHLSPRQRSVLILRDVLNWQATEIADLLGTTDTAVHSMVRRSRAQLERVRAGDTGPDDGTRRGLLDEYARAFESGDVSALVHLLTEDATCVHPDVTVSGRAALLEFLAHCPALGECRKIPITVRGNPGFGIYRIDGDGTHRAYAIDVMTLAPTGIQRIEVIEDRALFPTYGLPLTVSREESFVLRATG